MAAMARKSLNDPYFHIYTAQGLAGPDYLAIEPVMMALRLVSANLSHSSNPHFNGCCMICSSNGNLVTFRARMLIR
jgi:hypothetical protein